MAAFRCRVTPCLNVALGGGCRYYEPPSPSSTSLSPFRIVIVLYKTRHAWLTKESATAIYPRSATALRGLIASKSGPRRSPQLIYPFSARLTDF